MTFVRGGRRGRRTKGNPSWRALGTPGYTALADSLEPTTSATRSPLAVLAPVAEYDPARSIIGEQWALNQGTGGQLYRACYGSVGRAEIRSGALVLPGTVGNYASVPDSPELSFTGDLDVIVCVEPDSWDSASFRALVGKWLTGGNYSWIFGVSASKNPELYLSADGTTLLGPATTAPFSAFAPGERRLLRVTRRQSDGRVQFLTSPPTMPPVWTQHGTDQVLAAGSAIFDSTAPVVIGANSSGSQNMPGSFISATVRSAIDGPAVLDVAFAAAADLATSFVCSTGQTVTVTAVNAVDTNDPTLLDHQGVNYVYRTASNTYGINTPDMPELAGATELDMRFAIRLDSYAPGASQMLFAQGTSDPLVSAIRAYLVSNGGVNLELSNGTAWSSGTVISALPALGQQPGVGVALRITWDGSLGTYRGYYKLNVPDVGLIAAMKDDNGWTLGNSGAGKLAVPLFDSSSVVAIGSYSTGATPLVGRYFGAQVATTIGGAPALLVDFTKATDAAAATFVCDTGQTITIERVPTGVGARNVLVTAPVWMTSTDDYLRLLYATLADFGARQPFTIVMQARQWQPITYGAVTGLFDKRGSSSGSPGSPGYVGVIATGASVPSMRQDDGTAVLLRSPATTWVDGELETLVWVNTATTSQVDNRDSVGVSGARPSGSLANALALVIGRAGSSYGELEIRRFAVFDRALDATESAYVRSALGAL